MKRILSCLILLCMLSLPITAETEIPQTVSQCDTQAIRFLGICQPARFGGYDTYSLQCELRDYEVHNGITTLHIVIRNYRRKGDHFAGGGNEIWFRFVQEGNIYRIAQWYPFDKLNYRTVKRNHLPILTDPFQNSHPCPSFAFHVLESRYPFDHLYTQIHFAKIG